MSQKIALAARSFIDEEDGPTAVEYAVMLALIIVVCGTAYYFSGSQVNKTFISTGSTLPPPQPYRPQ